ncbi:MAG: beta-lactamase family protein [Lachnospiraceae bacterium]|nr:beta-lactamase family protein [Lachnospiraceae bacterium]
MERTELLQKVMDQAVADCNVAGVNFLVAREGKELLYLESGMADVENNQPIRRDTIFRLFSQTKPVTAVAAMILMERGQLDLISPVSEFFPSYNDQKYFNNGVPTPVPAPIRVQDLLRMTSGLTYDDPSLLSGAQTKVIFDECKARLGTDHEMTTCELASRLGEVTLEFAPGERFLYGTSADVLGAIVEVVSGMKLGEFMKKEIFDPLGMKDTAFFVPAEKRSRLAKAYRTVSENGKAHLEPYSDNNLGIFYPMDHAPAYEAGGAGLNSTLDDYLKFATMLLNGGEYGGVRILQPATVKFMTSGELLPEQQPSYNKWTGLNGFSYNCLMRICKNPPQAGLMVSPGEYGWDGWLGVFFANLPQEKMTILMGTQKVDGGTFDLTRKLKNVLLTHL